LLCATSDRYDDDTGREGGELEQLRRVLHVDGASILVEERANIERRMPTAADSGQVDMASVADRGSRRNQSWEPRPAQVFNGPLQFFSLTENVAQKISHHAGLFDGFLWWAVVTFAGAGRYCDFVW